MPQPKKGARLGSNPSHQRLMMRNLARSLFEHERIQTTEAKAKMLRPFAEKLITKAKRGGVHDRRLVLGAIEDRAVVHKLFADIGPRFADRNGGYTRILKLGPRSGDAAPMALIELVEEGTAVAVTGGDEAAETRKRRGLRRPARKRPVEDSDTATETDAEVAEAAAEDTEAGAIQAEADAVETAPEPVEEPGAALEADDEAAIDAPDESAPDK